MTTTPAGRPSAGPCRCWLCGVPGSPPPLGTLRPDIHVSGHLCPPCWTSQPRGRSSWTRSASVLYRALALPLAWHSSGLRMGWLETAALAHRVHAWHDVPKSTPPPSAPFGWITPETLTAAAADLQAREEEFDQARLAPSPRPPRQAGTR